MECFTSDPQHFSGLQDEHIRRAVLTLKILLTCVDLPLASGINICGPSDCIIGLNLRTC